MRQRGPNYVTSLLRLCSLFVAVNEANVFGRPTFALLRALFDNYEPYVTEKEDHTEGEHDEELAFLDAVIATQVMRRTREFLVEKGRSCAELKQQDYDICLNRGFQRR